MATKSLKQFGLAALVFATSQLVLAIILYANGHEYFHALHWLRFDSGHYLYIALHGYEIFPCAGKFGYAADSSDHCGNTAWLPGYPLLLRVAGLFSSDLELWGGIISKLFYFLSIFLLLKLSDLSALNLRSYLIGCIGAFWFGSIYYNAIFPISATVFLMLLSFFFLLNRKSWLAGVACFLASFFYSTGFLLCGVLAINILLRAAPIKTRIREALIVLFLGIAGMVAAFYVMYLDTGVWDGFIKVQAKYGHRLHEPIGNFLDKMQMIDIQEIVSFKYYQSIAVILVFLIFTWLFVRKKLYKNELHLLTWIFFLIYVAFPWIIGGDLAFYRSEALLFPVVLSFKVLPLKWLMLMLAVLLLIGLPMMHLYFFQALV